MKKVVFLSVVLFLLPIGVQAQDRPVGVSVSVHGSFLVPPASAYQDPEVPRFVNGEITDFGWLNEVDRGVGGEGRLLLRLPFGLAPFVGYHRSALHESGVTDRYWVNIYAQPIGDPSRFEAARQEVDYRTQGFSAGLLYDVPGLGSVGSVVQPYVLGEVRTEQLRATTRVTGVARNFYTSNGWTGPFRGRSEMETETTFGLGLGLGLRVSLSQLLPFGGVLERAALVPEVKLVRMRDAEITDRYYEWDIESIDPRSEYQSRPRILDRQDVEMEYVEFRLGLRYDLF